MTFFHDFEKSNSEEKANNAVSIIKNIIKNYPYIRYEIWRFNQEQVLDTLGLDYGKPKQ